MKKIIAISFIYFSSIGLGQTSISLDTLADSKFSAFIDNFNSYSQEPKNIRQRNVLSDINSSCDMNVAFNEIVTMGYRLAWVDSHRSGYDYIWGTTKTDSVALIPLCDSLNTDQEFFFIFENHASSYSIGNKYIIIASSLPTGTWNEIRYYFIREE